MPSPTEKTLNIPFRMDGDPDDVRKLVELIYSNQVSPVIRAEGEDARGAVLLAYNTSQALVKTIVSLLRNAEDYDETLNKAIIGLEKWCSRK